MTQGPAVLEINKLKSGNCSILSTAVVEVCWRAEGRVGFGQDFIAVFQLCLRWQGRCQGLPAASYAHFVGLFGEQKKQKKNTLHAH